MIEHRVVSGDCLSSIGKQYGFTWKILWDLPENAPLRAARKDPNILYPGDIVIVPIMEEGGEPRPVDASHRFRLKGEVTKLRLRLLFGGYPRRNVPCTMIIDDARRVQRTSDDEGRIECPIAPDAKVCVLIMHEAGGDEKYWIDIGSLDPVDMVSGIQQRLTNLAYNCGPVDGINGPLTKSGVRSFQTDLGLVVDGIAGPITKGRLVEVHGS